MKFVRIFLLIAGVLLSQLSYAQTGPTNFMCPDAKIFGSALLNKICWDCSLPITVFSQSFGTSGGKPWDANPDALCMCDFDGDDLPFDMPGLPLGLWQPTRLVEFVRKPYCSPTLGGRTLMDGTMLYGDNMASPKRQAVSKKMVFKNFNYWAFPLFAVLDLLSASGCNADGYVSIDLMYLSPIDPTWSEDELSFVMVPEVALFANPVALMACSAECLTGTAAPDYYRTAAADGLFWCAGCWGGIYPFTGNAMTNQENPMQMSGLLTARVLASLHRRGLARKTSGKQAACGGYLYPFLPKSQYKKSMVWPVAEADSNTCCHNLGDTYFKWGLGRNVPGLEEQVYLLERWTDCCIPLTGAADLF